MTKRKTLQEVIDMAGAAVRGFEPRLREVYLRELHRSTMPGCWHVEFSSSDYWEDTGEHYHVSIVNDQVRGVRHVPTERDMFGRAL